jgi:DNA replication and repair protein RecF
VLALKLAELAYIEQQADVGPLLLLDDVFSELDDARRHYLLHTLGGYQSVITTTNADVDAELSARHTTIHTPELQHV